MRILGQCQPGKLTGCKAPFPAGGLREFVESLPAYQQEGIESLIIPCQIHTPLPPNSVNTIENVLAYPDNSRFGLYHWKNLETIFLKRRVLEEVVKKGLFKPEQDYAALVAAIKKIGLSVVDIDIS